MQNKKALLQKNEVAIGTFLISRSQASLEVLSAAGYDFVVIDAEHFMVNPETIEQLITAAEAADILPFVRVQEDTHLIQRALDSGARGIIAPMVNSAEEAESVVNTAKYSPIGERGVCNPRSVTYGAKGPDHMARRYREQNENTMVIVQAETVQAAEYLNEILDIEGIDIVFIGPWDLAHSMGLTGQPDSNEVTGRIEEMLSQINQRGIPAGILAWDGDDAKQRIEQGFSFIVLSGDMLMLSSAANNELDKARCRG